MAQRVARCGGGAQAIIEAADDLGAELIVVGTHETKGIQRLKLGSTAERVVRGAPCPVAIVPASVGASAPKAIAVAYDGREPAQTALAWLEKEKNIRANTPVRDFRLDSRIGDMNFLRLGTAALLEAVGLNATAQRLQDSGLVQAADRFALEGLLALWQPATSN